MLQEAEEEPSWQRVEAKPSGGREHDSLEKLKCSWCGWSGRKEEGDAVRYRMHLA